VAIVVTDGRPQDGVQDVAARARAAGIEIFAIGVGRVDMQTLRQIASQPLDDHVDYVESYSVIEKLTQKFQEAFCVVSDLCATGDHDCEQICVSTPGAYKCACKEGFTLNNDGKTCSACSGGLGGENSAPSFLADLAGRSWDSKGEGVNLPLNSGKVWGWGCRRGGPLPAPRPPDGIPLLPGFRMFAVGVGNAVEDELREIASEPVAEHSFYTADFRTISKIGKKLQMKICVEEDPCECKSILKFQTKVEDLINSLQQKYILWEL
ncbi:cartilage matrix protein-like, partial [Empidonax traillii]|uniref:cartilage matrix protein-like n=1 Tax=Empidonax traillii TaxID=164674 RepID=UPI000FFD3E66